MSLYENKALKVSEMLTDKAEGSTVGFMSVVDILETLYPEGVPVSDMRNAILIVNVAICMLKIANGNNVDRNWTHLAGYGILGME